VVIVHAMTGRRSSGLISGVSWGALAPPFLQLELTLPLTTSFFLLALQVPTPFFTLLHMSFKRSSRQVLSHCVWGDRVGG
jgi:hypothetical protein